MISVISKKEKLGRQLKALAFSEIESSRILLKEESGTVAFRVHELRKHCKRMRALLRLIEPSLGPRDFTRQDRSCRDFARVLAQSRDAHVVVHSFEELMRFYKGKVDRRKFTAIFRGLKALRDAEVYEGEETVFPEALSMRMNEHAEWAAHLHFEKRGWALIGGGLSNTYRKGRRCFKETELEGDGERFHEWRKSVKYLMYQLQWLKPMEVGLLGELLEGMKLLADLLGDEHDLTMLRLFVDGDALGAASEEKLGALMELIVARQGVLRKEAVALGGELYAEKPRVWEQWMHGLWKQW